MLQVLVEGLQRIFALVCLRSLDGYHEGIRDGWLVFFSNGILAVGGVRGGEAIEGEGEGVGLRP